MTRNTQIESLIENHDTPVQEKTKGDKFNIFLLFILYTLQGVPLGLSLSIPIIMQNKHKSFNDQAKFSIAVWPFSLKLMWAPIVDSLYIRKLGRRKSWLTPIQYFLGLFFFVTGFYINEWLVNAEKPNINALTLMFFLLNFLAATQDIIVDGWAISMLKRKNISYAAMCNGAGQAFGIFLGFVLLIILLSESFWNKFRYSPEQAGIISLQGYFYFWGVMYIVITTLVAMFKSEKDYLIAGTDGVRINIVDTYMLLFKIIKLSNIKILAMILLTIKVSFSSVDGAYKLKLIDGGVTKDQIAGIELLFMPIRIGLPFFINKFMSHEKPLKHYFNILPYRLLVGAILTVVIYVTPMFLAKTGAILIVYKIVLVIVYILQQLMVVMMMLMAMAFYANISDPQIGGTNMTLLATIGNIGVAWSRTVSLWLIDLLTFKKCSIDHNNVCSSTLDRNVCSLSGGTCQIIIDGFYIETFLCTIYGVIWYYIFRKYINRLQSKNVKEWHVRMKTLEPL